MTSHRPITFSPNFRIIGTRGKPVMKLRPTGGEVHHQTIPLEDVAANQHVVRLGENEGRRLDIDDHVGELEVDVEKIHLRGTDADQMNFPLGGCSLEVEPFDDAWAETSDLCACVDLTKDPDYLAAVALADADWHRGAEIHHVGDGLLETQSQPLGLVSHENPPDESQIVTVPTVESSHREGR